MIRLRLGDTVVRVHALALLTPALAWALGARADVLALLVALAAHEGCHLAAARLLRVGVESLDLMPFGGALVLENPYRLGRAQLLGVALAGPLGNLAGLVLTAALAWWGVLPPRFSFDLLRLHAILGAFNLLPALPLDGGRALYALFSRPRARARALRVLLGGAHALALALLAVAAAGWARTGRLNLALPLAAVFLLASGSREKRAALLGEAEALLERMDVTRRGFCRPERLRVLAVDERTQAVRVLRALRPREEALLAVYRGGEFVRLLDSRAVERALLDAPAGDAPLLMARVGRTKAGRRPGT